MTITDVPLNAIRRFVKPVRVGPLAFDLAWTILFFAAIVLRGLVTRLPF
jgi:YggT family protein